MISEPDEQAPVHKGTVVETMSSSGYTYVLLKSETKKYFWIASPEMFVKNGNKITVPRGYVMRDFTSKTLKKKFPSILFVENFVVDDSEVKSPEKVVQNNSSSVNPGTVIKASNGYTIAECYENVSKLDGQSVRIRGKVIKYLPGIMGKNWIHLQDGTGKKDRNDLTITTKGITKAGDTILITGKLAKDKDFGSGYKYSVIVEDAIIIVE